MRGILSALWIAVRAIGRSKLRAALTVLGILIGVAAVVVMVALGTGTRAVIAARFSSLGTNIIFVWPQTTQASGARQGVQGRLTEADAQAIGKEARSVAAVVPFSPTAMQIIGNDRNWPTQVMGTTRAYWGVRGFTFASGESWTEIDEQLNSKVCVFGEAVREALFGSADPIGQYVRMGRYPFRVVGVLAKKGSSPFGEDQDDRLLMPVGSFRSRIYRMPTGRVMSLMASATSERTADSAVRQITTLLRQRHHIANADDESDFVVRNPLELRRTSERIFTTLTLLLSAIASVSLLLAGWGS